MKEKLLNWLNTALMLNMFFVFAAFGWFAVAVVGRSLDIPLGLELWYKLWQPLFNPAIGILMLGAIVSGITSWINRKFGQSAPN